MTRVACIFIIKTLVLNDGEKHFVLPYHLIYAPHQTLFKEDPTLNKVNDAYLKRACMMT